ncbi:MAG: hypothetical protein IPQ02_04625 [Saprospiraceae bacterium]|nr:hypothetical protein [Candidatus Defluviibacterium haderslevense]
MRIGLFLIGIIVVSLFDPVLGQSQPEELGLIKWNRDLDLAQSLSLKTKKPILILFKKFQDVEPANPMEIKYLVIHLYWNQ